MLGVNARGGMRRRGHPQRDDRVRSSHIDELKQIRLCKSRVRTCYKATSGHEESVAKDASSAANFQVARSRNETACRP